MEVKKVKSIRRFKAGYEIRDEVWDGSEYGGKDTDIKYAYNIHGDCIGDPKTAHRLCIKRGIMPIMNDKAHSVCSVGFSHKDGKWYGWSHRAIYGFKVGQVVGSDSIINVKHAGKRGWPTGHICQSTQEAEAMARLFASEVS